MAPKTHGRGDAAVVCRRGEGELDWRRLDLLVAVAPRVSVNAEALLHVVAAIAPVVAGVTVDPESVGIVRVNKDAKTAVMLAVPRSRDKSAAPANIAVKIAGDRTRIESMSLNFSLSSLCAEITGRPWPSEKDRNRPTTGATGGFVKWCVCIAESRRYFANDSAAMSYARAPQKQSSCGLVNSVSSSPLTLRSILPDATSLSVMTSSSSTNKPQAFAKLVRLQPLGARVTKSATALSRERYRPSGQRSRYFGKTGQRPDGDCN